MAGNDFGGTMQMRLGDASLLTLRGTFSVMPGRSSVEVVTNQDGSADRNFTPTNPSAECTFADNGADWSALVEADRQTITIVEDKSGVTHHFINGFFSGRASLNRMNGEVTGLTLNGETYRKTVG